MSGRKYCFGRVKSRLSLMGHVRACSYGNVQKLLRSRASSYEVIVLLTPFGGQSSSVRRIEYPDGSYQSFALL